MTSGAQSFLNVVKGCWSRPSLLIGELMWRWAAGIPIAALLIWRGLRIYEATQPQLAATGIGQFSIAEPMQGAMMVAGAYSVLAPPLEHLLVWLAPLAMVWWCVASGVGRNAVLHRYDPSLPSRPLAMATLQVLRVAAFAGSIWFWFAAIRWSAAYALGGVSPDVILYSALVICLSLGVFTLWALVSWVFSIAPLLPVLEGLGVGASLRRSVRLGRLTGRLVEVNLIMGMVKLALLVLAMVFSATPLPFSDQLGTTALAAWWVLVSVLYLVASDFFQVVRLAAFVEYWRARTVTVN